MANDFVREATAAGGVEPARARAAVKDPALSGAFTGGAEKAWHSYRERLNHLAAAEAGFKGIAIMVVR